MHLDTLIGVRNQTTPEMKKHYLLKKLSVTLLATLVLAGNSNAIVIKHDKPADSYLANQDDFPPLATFYNIGVHGTLIAPQWVLTAAHTVFCLDEGQIIKIGDERAEVEARYSYPTYKLGKSNDLALIKLKAPVVDVQPTKIYRKHNEDGQTVWFIGSGGTGTGLTGETVGYKDNNGTLRKAQNSVASVSKSDLTFIFDSGDDGLELEGASGNGDSGGPAFIAVDGEYYLLGVSSRTGSWFKDVGEYGVKELYTRVSVHAEWIDKVIAADKKQRRSIASQDPFLQPGMTPDNIGQICESISL